VFALVFAAAVLVRLGIVLTFWPALYYIGDSFSYTATAYDHTLVGFDPVHPSGYPLLLDLLALPGRSLVTIVVAQHLAGLATGVLVYALLVQLGLHRLLAAAAAAIVLLESWQVVLEQHVLAEPFFTLALVASAYLLLTRSSTRATAASGFLLGFAVLLRVIALVAFPLWLAYAAWKHRLRRPLALGTVALVVPVVIYASVHAGAGRGFALTEWDGWLLYGRVAGIADCRGARFLGSTAQLCRSKADRERRARLGWEPSNYIFSPQSPAVQVYGYTPGSNSALRRFALAIVISHPLTYAHTVASDASWAFRPRAGFTGMDPGIFLHEQYESLWRVYGNPGVRRYFGGYRLRSYGPRDAVVWYARKIRAPRLLLGLLLLAALLSMSLSVVGRGRLSLPHQPESTFLAAVTLALWVGAVAVAELNLRFLVPALPLLVSAGALALSDLAALSASAWRARGLRRSTAAAR
jgi:Dolichyl-phosphate-mannose-protein mannosyltransferase